MNKKPVKFPNHIIDHAYSKESFSLLSEQEGDLLKTDPLPRNLATYYSENSYISHQKNFSSFTEKIYSVAKNYQLKKKTALLEKHLVGSKKVLDFGAGTGSLVSYLRNNKWHALGVEPSENARAIALENNCVLHSSLEDIPNQQFNVIMLWHVLEHLPDYSEKIDELMTFLNPGGHLVLALPNFKSWDARHYKMHWAAFDVPRHLWHFSKIAIQQLAKDKGLVLEKTYPMPLDAFYVSLVSEKFKGSSHAFLLGFFKGFYSNLNAWITGEYSSLIYVLKKPIEPL
ncbi:MAG: class I SAM-dependent methyltransferase [Flavobacteriaceae bacterium]